ncbi:hypothetical protein COP2_048460 [Malus domestica]
MASLAVLKLFSKREAKHGEVKVNFVTSTRQEFKDESEGQDEKKKGILGITEIENPNLVKSKTVKAQEIDIGRQMVVWAGLGVVRLKCALDG